MATEKRLIDANELVDTIYRSDEVLHSTQWETYEIVDQIDRIPTVEVVHGRWVGYHEADIGYDEYGVRCSNCNFEVEDHEVDFIMNYCPNCGADMRERKDNGNRIS